MNEGRCHFHPCEYNECLYLSGHPSSYLEAFRCVEKVFTPLKLRLPESYSPCVMFLCNGQLNVMSDNYVSVWEGQERLQQVSVLQHEKFDVLTAMPPVLDLRHRYVYLSHAGKCIRVKMDGTEWAELGVQA